MPNVSVQVRRLVRRNLQRLVGIFILAVHALALSEIVAARSMLFAGGWWRIHFTCGSPYILIPTSAFTVAPLVARKVERLVGSIIIMSLCAWRLFLQPAVNYSEFSPHHSHGRTHDDQA